MFRLPARYIALGSNIQLRSVMSIVTAAVTTKACQNEIRFGNTQRKGDESMATNYQTLLVTKAGGVTTIAFNRPEKRNAMSPQLHSDMFDLLTDLRYDKETRVIVLTGVGDNFCAGQDLKQYSLEMES